MIKFTAKAARSTSDSMAVKVHAAGCKCVTGRTNAKTGYQWGLEACTLAAALAEVRESEDAETRAIPVTAAPCAIGE